jgi:hypothetical protein
MALCALLLFVTVPLAGWWYARKRVPGYTRLITGAALGLVISPLSFGLYATFYLSVLGFPTGLLGMFSSVVHEAPGYHLALWLGVVKRYALLSTWGHIYVEMLNGVLWTPVYGLLGFVLDWVRATRLRYPGSAYRQRRG